MPVTFPAQSVFFEAHFLGEDLAELRLPCEAVVLEPRAITTRGVEARHLAALKWTPDALSFRSLDQNHWYAVGRPSVVDPLTARFARR